MMKARAVTTGECDVMHAGLPEKPRRINRALRVPNVFRNTKPQIFQIGLSARNVRRKHVEVIEAGNDGWTMNVVPLCEALHVLRLEEKLERKSQRILDPDRVSDSTRRSGRNALHAHAELAEILLCDIELFVRANTVAHQLQRWVFAFSKHQGMVQVLFKPP